jgi:hypothetical protein
MLKKIIRKILIQQERSTVMKRQILFAAILSMFLISLANAISLDLPEMQKNVDVYNSKIDKAPVILKDILGNEKINMNITRDDGSLFRAGLDVVNARIERTVDGGWNDPTIVITTTESAINIVRRSNDPIAAFQEQRDLGQINFEAKGLLTKAKLGAVLSSTSVLQFGYSIFFG